MADNVKYNEPTSGTIIATDDLGGGVQIQRVKVAVGTDGVATDVSPGSPMPVAVGLTADVAGSQAHFNSAGTNTLTQVKATGGRLAMAHVANKNAQTIFLQVFNALAANVTLGTTTPTLALAVPPGDGQTVYGQLEYVPPPIEFAAALSYALTTTPTGSAAPSVALVVNLLYK